MKQHRVISTNPEPQSSPSILHANESQRKNETRISGIHFYFADFKPVAVMQRHFKSTNEAINQNKIYPMG